MFGATKSLLFGMDTATDTGLASLRNATTWLNSPPLTADGLRGKVVLVDFCTYTCVNWLRTLPYLRAWDAKPTAFTCGYALSRSAASPSRIRS